MPEIVGILVIVAGADKKKGWKKYETKNIGYDA